MRIGRYGSGRSRTCLIVVFEMTLCKWCSSSWMLLGLDGRTMVLKTISIVFSRGVFGWSGVSSHRKVGFNIFKKLSKTD